MFKLSFSMENDAFVCEPEEEASRILQAVSRLVQGGRSSGQIYDINSNLVGSWEITE